MRIGSSATNVSLAHAQPRPTSTAEAPAQNVATHAISEQLRPRPSGAPGAAPPRQPFARARSNALHLPDKNGAAGSRANRSAGSSSGISAEDVFGYLTAEISNPRQLNCVGLTAEWLRIRNGGTAQTRMEALKEGGQMSLNAAHRQHEYSVQKQALQSRGAHPHVADIHAQNAVMRAAGLNPSGAEKRYKAADAIDLLNDLTRIGATHLVGLYLADGTAHSVAVASSNRDTTLFDPNYGEFTVHKLQADSLLMALNAHYQCVSTITTQKID